MTTGTNLSTNDITITLTGEELFLIKEVVEQLIENQFDPELYWLYEALTLADNNNELFEMLDKLLLKLTEL